MYGLVPGEVDVDLCICVADVSVDVQSDLSLLLDCLKLQNSSRDAKKQALQTVATICSDNGKFCKEVEYADRRCRLHVPLNPLSVAFRCKNHSAQ